MKKFFACIFAILYIGSSTGATLHMHYCMGKLVEQGLWHGKAKKCGNCSTKEDSSCKKQCCRDEHKFIKVDKDHKTVASAFQFLAITSLATPINYIELPQVQLTSIAQEFPVNNAPPRSCTLHSYIFHCTFRI